MRQISCGHLHTLALTDSGEVYSFGWGSAGALGVGDRKHRVRPTLIESLQVRVHKGISTNLRHDCVSFSFGM